MIEKKVGDRVRVDVKDVSAWNADALKVLQGQTGVVTEVLTHERATGHKKALASCLVKFDKSPGKTWKWGSDVQSHWFDVNELEVLA
jgi:hypothetical protein